MAFRRRTYPQISFIDHKKEKRIKELKKAPVFRKQKEPSISESYPQISLIDHKKEEELKEKKSREQLGRKELIEKRLREKDGRLRRLKERDGRLERLKERARMKEELRKRVEKEREQRERTRKEMEQKNKDLIERKRKEREQEEKELREKIEREKKQIEGVEKKRELERKKLLEKKTKEKELKKKAKEELREGVRKEQEQKEKELREKKQRAIEQIEKARREKELKRKELIEKKINERELRRKAKIELKEKARGEKELKKKELLEKRLREKELRERVMEEQREKARRERESGKKKLREKTEKEREQREKVKRERELKKEELLKEKLRKKELEERKPKELFAPKKIQPVKHPKILLARGPEKFKALVSGKVEKYSKIKKYKPFIIVLAFFVLISVILGILIFQDRRKGYGYILEEEADYSRWIWEEKANDQGYSKYSDSEAEFEWKADIYVPDTSFIFKVRDIARLTFHIKNLEGTVKVPQGVSFERMEDYPVIAGQRTISDKKELILVDKVHFASFLGLNFVSPNQDRTINVNEKDFNIVTIHFSKNSKIIKYGDGNYPAGAYEINDRTYFFHSFVTPAIVYYSIGYHVWINIAIIILGVAIFCLGLYLLKYIKLLRPKIKERHFIYGLLICAGIMIMLAALMPNPKSTVLVWDSHPVEYETEHRVAKDAEVTNYLWLALGITRSIDAMVIGDTNCGPSRYRYYYLAKHSVQKFIVLEDSPCRQFIQDLAPKKTVIVPQDKVEEELAKLKDRSYPFSFLFIPATKIIVLLSNLLVFVAIAYLMWRALTIKKVKDVLMLAVLGLVLFFGLMLSYIIIGILAHMPITYHGVSDLGFIMTNYFVPGVFRGGNNLRTLFGFLGGGLCLLLIPKVRARITPGLFLASAIIFLSLFVIPPTEYYAKRFMLSVTSAEAYVWDYKQDTFNSFHLFQSIRDNNLMDYTRYCLSKKARGDKDLTLGGSLEGERRFKEAMELYEEMLIKYKDLPGIRAETLFRVAELYFTQGRGEIGIEEESVGSEEYYITRAAEAYTEYLTDYPEGRHIDRALYHLARCYQILRKYDTAIEKYSEYVREFPEGNFIDWSRYYLAECYQRSGQQAQAIEKYWEYIKNYPVAGYVGRAKFNMGECYNRMGQREKAIEIYSKLIQNHPQSIWISRTKFEIGQAYERLGKRDESLSAYQKLVVDYPEDMFTVSLSYRRFRWIWKGSKEERAFMLNLYSAIAEERGENYERARDLYRMLLGISLEPSSVSEGQIKVGKLIQIKTTGTTWYVNLASNERWLIPEVDILHSHFAKLPLDVIEPKEAEEYREAGELTKDSFGDEAMKRLVLGQKLASPDIPKKETVSYPSLKYPEFKGAYPVKPPFDFLDKTLIFRLAETYYKLGVKYPISFSEVYEGLLARGFSPDPAYKLALYNVWKGKGTEKEIALTEQWGVHESLVRKLEIKTGEPSPYFDQAKEVCNEVISRYPGTALSAHAYLRLAQMKILIEEPDKFKQRRLLEELVIDTDQDNLSDLDELRLYHTDPLNQDTDKDGVSDGKEVEQGNNPKGPGVLDMDKDSLLNKEEIKLGTSPYNKDTDEDGVSDKEEIEKGQNPLGPEKPEKLEEEIKPKAGVPRRTGFLSLFGYVGESRGMSIYFAGVVCLFILLLLRRNFRTLTTLLIIFMLGRGLMRIGEQDPFRAYYSFWPGLLTGIKIAGVLLAVNLAWYVLVHLVTFRQKLQEIKAVMSKDISRKEKVSELFKQEIQD